jgi:hypothetical protein
MAMMIIGAFPDYTKAPKNICMTLHLSNVAGSLRKLQTQHNLSNQFWDMPVHDHCRKNLKFHSKICFQNLNTTALQSNK